MPTNVNNPPNEVSVVTTGNVSKRMATDRVGGDDGEMPTCSIAITGVRIGTDQIDQLAGMPIGSIRGMFDEVGMPWQRFNIAMPKRELLVSGQIKHVRDSGAEDALIEVRAAKLTALTFVLSPIEENKEAVAYMQCRITWKAAGDEVEDVKYMLKRTCSLNLVFREAPKQQSLFPTNAASTAREDMEAIGIGEGTLLRSETVLVDLGDGLPPTPMNREIAIAREKALGLTNTFKELPPNTDLTLTKDDGKKKRRKKSAGGLEATRKRIDADREAARKVAEQT